MRKCKRHISLLLALIMSLCLVIPAHASGGYDGTGTVVDGGAGGATVDYGYNTCEDGVRVSVIDRTTGQMVGHTIDILCLT